MLNKKGNRLNQNEEWNTGINILCSSILHVSRFSFLFDLIDERLSIYHGQGSTVTGSTKSLYSRKFISQVLLKFLALLACYIMSSLPLLSKVSFFLCVWYIYLAWYNPYCEHETFTLHYNSEYTMTGLIYNS